MSTSNCTSLFTLLLTVTSISLLSCNVVEDQRNLPGPHSTAVNPLPTVKTIENSKHEVLIAVVDTGTDYNHPLLSASIHYTLNAAGTQILGAGFDFIGQDAWASPYLARTSALQSGATQADRDLDASWIDSVNWLLGERPGFSKFLNPYRLHSSENSFTIHHGTHVAGLASYDDEKIGLLPYRVLPVNRETAPDFEYEKKFVENLISAFDAAKKAGAKIVNLSIGTSFRSTDPNFSRLKKLEVLFADAVRTKPEMVFVAAAGNESSWIDGKSRFSFPCGINARNLLCVGALKDDGSLADFTNIPLIDSPLVFALGTDVLSTMPTSLCPSDSLASIIEASESKAARDGKSSELPQLRKKVLDRLDQACVQIPSKARLSGTSMATPIISRLIAQLAIANPTLSGEDLIQKLLSGAQKTQLGPLPIYKLKAPVPSFYKSALDESDNWLSFDEIEEYLQTNVGFRDLKSIRWGEIRSNRKKTQAWITNEPRFFEFGFPERKSN